MVLSFDEDGDVKGWMSRKWNEFRLWSQSFAALDGLVIALASADTIGGQVWFPTPGVDCDLLLHWNPSAAVARQAR